MFVTLLMMHCVVVAGIIATLLRMHYVVVTGIIAQKASANASLKRA